MANHSGPEQIEAKLMQSEEQPLDRAGLEAALAAIARRRGIRPPRFDQAGQLVLRIGRGPAVALIHAPGAALLVLVAEMPEGSAADDAVLRRALRTNGSAAISGGGCFGKIPETDTLQFMSLSPLAMDDAELEAALIAFARLAAEWHDRIALALDLAGIAADRAANRSAMPVSAAI
jgi:Tir chaperone protein (CesT) family